MYLKKASKPSGILIDEDVFGLADIIENQYVIKLATTLKLATVNRVTALTIKIWHAYIKDLGYKSLLELRKLANEIEIKRPSPTEIYNKCIKGRL